MLLGVWVLAVSAGAVALWEARSEVRASQQTEFEERAQIAARFVSNYVQRARQRMSVWAETTLSGTQVSTASLRSACTSLRFTSCGLYDAEGSLLTSVPTIPPLVGQDFAGTEPVATVLRTGAPAITSVTTSATLNEPVVPFGLPFRSEDGMRVLTGTFRVEDGALTRASNLSFRLPDTLMYIVDDAGNLAASTVGPLPGSITSLTEFDRALAESVAAAPSGRTGDRYFAAAPIPGTPWQLVSTVRSQTLYAPVAPVERSGVWSLVGWAVVGLLAVAVLTRAVHHWTRTSAELALVHARHEERLHHARDVNDTIVQRLVAAETAADLGRQDTSRRLLADASTAARAWIGAQLEDTGRLTPGSLRRATPAQRSGIPDEEKSR